MDNQMEIIDKEKRREQQKLNKLKPKFILLMKGFNAKGAHDLKNREQQFLTLGDMQQLILSCFLPAPKLNFKPEWFILQRVLKAEKAAVFLLDFDADELHSKFSTTFDDIVRFDIYPDWLDYLLTINLSKNQTAKLRHPDGTMKIKTQNTRKIESENEELNSKSKKFTKLDLLLSPGQMLEECYQFPKPLSDIRHTIRKRYLPVTENSPLFAIDCEMCLAEGNESVLTRVSIVDENYNLVLDTLVKPEVPIKDYITRFSGITKEMLDPVDITLSDVKKILKKIIPRDAILCGQSLQNDLKALKTFHPYCIDTSVIYNLSGSRGSKPGLKTLSSIFLEEKIQQGKRGHCSVEDARATMKLVNLKLKNGLIFADRVLDNRINWQTPVVSLSTFFELHEIDVRIYYDYINMDMSDKFISVFKRMDGSLLSSIFRIVNSDKKICVILTKNGYCYIKV
ncbi:RNA exonuclease 1 [Tetranychus urticae]|uniref:Exonuclease domain-containing protein n=1 Tax=Tetranychus urticae TaxID=32264 RepID=T1K2S0_TETUR|nr:RNA exonuclease 1 [Tetranychus urticae]XP_015781522.1 RNA exonuclease 1 [Tetranychus urticae]XP_015781523.1 RNA exonuclease 1 [Tetranychus urticae]XP_015781524.1 RNA exonuclease 1 [Tetranychus urticae]XP_015781525.1 RNA exonuclease 1 [Tetranychus urticae]